MHLQDTTTSAELRGREVNHSPAGVRLKSQLLARLKVTEAMAYKGSQEKGQSNQSAENRRKKK